jgi:hypothetical protein
LTAYVDTNLLGGADPKLVEGAILSQNDAGVWAISSGYQAKVRLLNAILISRTFYLTHRLTTHIVQFTAKEQADIRAAFAVHQLPEGTKQEQAAKAKAIESGVQGNGIYVRGIKFMCTLNTADSIYGTKKVSFVVNLSCVNIKIRIELLDGGWSRHRCNHGKN